MNAIDVLSRMLDDKLVHSKQTKHFQQVVIRKRTLTVSNARVNTRTITDMALAAAAARPQDGWPMICATGK